MTHLDLELGEAPSSASNPAPAPAEIVRVPENKVGGEAEGSASATVDLETGSWKFDRDCRICHLSLEQTDLGTNPAAASIVLGCSCKDDLAAAHKHCAEAWFKIKGNKTCEICGAVARNVTGPAELESMDHWSEPNDTTHPPQPAPHPIDTQNHLTETQNFWRGHRFLNFLLACMVFAFVISWLFHFNIHLRDT